jgi:hypothetical protein
MNWSLRFRPMIHASCHHLPGLNPICAMRFDLTRQLHSRGALRVRKSRPSKLMTAAGDSKPTSMPSGPAVAFERARFRSFDMMRHVLAVAPELLWSSAFRARTSIQVTCGRGVATHDSEGVRRREPVTNAT